MNDIDKKDEMVSYFYKHIIPIHFCYEKEDEKRQFIITSFVLSVCEHWFLITAGHVLQKIREELIDKDWSLTSCSLLDGLGLTAKFKEPFPFTFDITKWAFIPVADDDYSFDYGVHHLSDYFIESLLLNNIQPLNEEVWKKQPDQVVDSAIIGIPSELINFNQEIEFYSGFIFADIVDEKPDGFKDVSWPQIYAKINLENAIGTIEGMSGGPLFGFQLNEIGEMRYWLLGLQSRWLPDSEFIAVCPMKIFGSMLETIISKSIK